MLQHYWQQQIISDTEKAQAHLTDCRNHFLELLQKANGIVAKANDKYINNNCADVLNTSIIKQIKVANILPSRQSYLASQVALGEATVTDILNRCAAGAANTSNSDSHSMTVADYESIRELTTNWLKVIMAAVENQKSR
jgi:C1A family cysteine protease